LSWPPDPDFILISRIDMAFLIFHTFLVSYIAEIHRLFHTRSKFSPPRVNPLPTCRIGDPYMFPSIHLHTSSNDSSLYAQDTIHVSRYIYIFNTTDPYALVLRFLNVCGGDTVVFPEFPTVMYLDIHIESLDPRSQRTVHFHCAMGRLSPCALP
jgi:hypothetical protein